MTYELIFASPLCILSDGKSNIVNHLARHTEMVVSNGIEKYCALFGHLLAGFYADPNSKSCWHPFFWIFPVVTRTDNA